MKFGLKRHIGYYNKKEFTVSEVASMVGFQDFNNFGRLFRKKYGFSPSKVWEISEKT